LIEGLKEPLESVINPPSSATPVDLALIKMKESSLRKWPTALIKAPPVYPPEAKMMHAQGTVDVKVIIGLDGHIQDPQIIDGPKPLCGAAVDSARQWVYRYFNVMGQPRPVETVIHFIFTIGWCRSRDCPEMGYVCISGHTPAIVGSISIAKLVPFECNCAFFLPFTSLRFV
jgi:hypothetical protein